MRSRAVLPVVGIAVLSACSTDEDSTWPDTESDRAALQEENAVTAELGLEAALLAKVKPTTHRGVYLLPSMAQAMLEHWAVPIDHACVKTSALADTDEDGIPRETKIFFHCGVAAPPGSTYRMELTGMAWLRDPNDRLAGDGFDLDLDSLTWAVVDGKPMNATTLDGNVSMRTHGSPPKLALGFDFEEKLEWRYQATKADGATHVDWHGVTAAGQYVPDSWAAGIDPLAAGTLSFAGTSEFVAEDGSRTGWPWIKASLHWSRRCKAIDDELPGFDRGSILFAEVGAPVLYTEFYSCTVWESYPQ